MEMFCRNYLELNEKRLLQQSEVKRTYKKKLHSIQQKNLSKETSLYTAGGFLAKHDNPQSDMTE